MDPKKASSLDPTLQAAYDRVMGVATDPAVSPAPAPTPVTPTSPADTSTNPIPAPDPNNMPQMPNVQPAVPPEPQPTPPSPEPTNTPVMEQTVQTPMATVESTVTMKPQAFVAKGEGGKKGISPVIWVVGGIAFLLVYTVVWIKVFNLPVPFINQ